MPGFGMVNPSIKPPGTLGTKSQEVKRMAEREKLIQVATQLNQEQLQWLEERARIEGNRSKASILRQALTHYQEHLARKEG